MARLERPLTASPGERRRGVVIRADERAEARQGAVAPDIAGKTTVEAAPLGRNEAVASPNFSLDVGQNLAPLVVKAKRTLCASKSFAVNVLQQIEDSRRPRVTSAPDRRTDSNDGRMRAAVEGNLWLEHVSVRFGKAQVDSFTVGAAWRVRK